MKIFLKNKKKWIFQLIKIGVLIGLGFFIENLFFKKEKHFHTALIKKGDLSKRITLAGTVVPHKRAIIFAPYNGYIKKIFVKIGDFIQTGSPLISIQHSSQEQDEDTYPLQAPFAGTIVQIFKTEGEFVTTESTQNQNTLIRVDDLSRLFIEANASEMEINKLKVGQEVIIKASAIPERLYAGKIQNLSLSGRDQKEWNRARIDFPIKIEMTNPDQAIKPGMSVMVDVITHQVSQALILPLEFLQKEGNHFFVITESGQKLPIEVGIQNEEAFEIRSHIPEGTKIRQIDFLSLIQNP